MRGLLFKARTQGEDLRLALGDEDRILIVSGQGMICCNNGPVIVHPDYIRCTCIDHRLDRQCHARLQKDPLSLRCEVRDLRIFMKVGTNSMSNQLADNAIAEFLGICLDCRGDVIQMIACFCNLIPS